MKPLKRINMLGNCWILSSSLKPFLINSQPITKGRNVINKKLLVSRRWVDRERRNASLSVLKLFIHLTITEGIVEGC